VQSKESNIKLLLLGRAVSLFGSTIYLIVLPLYILNTTKNLKTTGIFFAAVNFPTIIVSIFIGTIPFPIKDKSVNVFLSFQGIAASISKAFASSRLSPII